MAVTVGEGHSRIITNRRWEDYRSLKQAHQGRHITEVIISGSCGSSGSLTEISFADNIINYIVADDQVYIRCEADDNNAQDNKYVYIQYQKSTGEIRPILTADITSDTGNEIEIEVVGATDFFRLRQMISEVESNSSGGKSVLLCDDDWDGAADTYGEIKDGHSSFALERFFTQPSATCKSYLGSVKAHACTQDMDGATAGLLLSVTYTPRILSTVDGFAEPQIKADITENWQFDNTIDWQPCIELEPASEVIFKVGDIDSPCTIHIEATMLEVYPLIQPNK